MNYQELTKIFNKNYDDNINGYYDPIFCEELDPSKLSNGHCLSPKFKQKNNFGKIPVHSGFDNWFGSVIESPVLQLFKALDFFTIHDLGKNPHVFLENENGNKIQCKFPLKHIIPDHKNLCIQNKNIAIPNNINYIQLISEIVFDELNNKIITAFAIKTLHYILFKKFNYGYLFECGGQNNAQILKQFYISYKNSKISNDMLDIWTKEKKRYNFILNNCDEFYGLQYGENIIPFAVGVTAKLHKNISIVVWYPCHSEQVATFYKYFYEDTILKVNLRKLDFQGDKVISSSVHVENADKSAMEKILNCQITSIKDQNEKLLVR